MIGQSAHYIRSVAGNKDPWNFCPAADQLHGFDFQSIQPNVRGDQVRASLRSGINGHLRSCCKIEGP